MAHNNMNPGTLSIKEFIEDFQLEVKDYIICFDAVIYFTTERRYVQLPSEVMIIKGTTIAIIHLLHPDVLKHGIPTVYNKGSERVSYRKDHGLVIHGRTSYGENYILSIHPADRDCNADTLAAIHGRIYN